MNPTATLLSTDRFPSDWSDDPDSDPPPGFEFADALLKALVASGATSRNDSLPADWFEHSNWFFSVDWNGDSYRFRVERSLEDTEPPQWMVAFSKHLGVFGSLFGKRERRFEVNEDLKGAVAQCLSSLTGVDQIDWITEDDATRVIYGEPAINQTLTRRG